MKIITLFFVISLVSMISSVFGQTSKLELTFTAFDSASHVQLNSIRVMNRTQGGEIVLYWPDTVLSISYEDVPEFSGEKNSFQVFQNYPNPVVDQTTISMYVPEKDKVSITVTDILGRMIIQTERILERGKHSFRYHPGGGNLHYFSASWGGQIRAITILLAGLPSGGAPALKYTGSEDYSPQIKAIEEKQNFSFSPGDILLYIGNFDTLQSGILDSPEESQIYTFQFATNIPCPGMPIVEYEGHVYNTIQIFSQCWFKENLNVGNMIAGATTQYDNGIIEKFCYNDEPDSCTIYGGLYQWNEMMQYTTHEGVQGICPPDWHIPTDEEWKVLEGAVDSLYGIGHSEWEKLAYILRGHDAGKKLKTISGWYANGNGTDLFGFSGLPGGERYYTLFGGVPAYGYWWTSTEYHYGWAIRRMLFSTRPYSIRYSGNMYDGFSVRCLRDY